MSKLRQRGEQIRQFIWSHVGEHPSDIAALTAQEFGITRQAVNKHIKSLVEQESLLIQGATRNKIYLLRPLVWWTKNML
jgi:predicted transcriptional regulator